MAISKVIFDFHGSGDDDVCVVKSMVGRPEAPEVCLPTMEKGLSLCLISMTIDKGDCLPSMCLCQYGSDFHNTLFQLSQEPEYSSKMG